MRHKEKNERLVLVPFAISNIPLLYKWISELAETIGPSRGPDLDGSLCSARRLNHHSIFLEIAVTEA